MTGSEAEPSPAATEDTVQQIPAVIRVTQPPAVTDARDKLLAAVGAEAERLAETALGQAATALEALARAYAIGATSTATALGDAARGAALTARSQRGLVLTPATPLDTQHGLYASNYTVIFDAAPRAPY
ncbi:hypothetical protein AB0J63_48955 [Streptosporangium canum]|uniref:hypothetical protein n=1 Tax=Streptosporangium canum TaxID=324952 RepID=UPI00343169B9